MEFIDDFCAITHATNLTFYRTRLAVSTFLETNQWFTGKIIILSLESDPLSNDNIRLIKLLYDNIEEIQVKELDLKPIASKISKKGWSKESLLDFLFLYSFKIKSRGNLYFSNKLFFQRDLSDSLCDNGISSPVVSNTFPSEADVRFPIDPDLLYVSEGEISEEIFKEIYQSLLSFNLFDPNCKSDSIIKICKLLGIQINRLSNRYLMRTSFYPDSKYTEFIRYHKGIHAIKLNSEESSNHKRIHTYWNHLKNKHCQVKVSSPSKISKTSEIKEIKIDQYYNNIEDSQLKNNFGRNLSGLDIAVYTICDDKFTDGARVMISSFIKNNTWFNGKIVILFDIEYSKISKENRDLISRVYEKIEFQEVDTSVYLDLIENFKRVANRNQLRLIPSLFTFEIFEKIKNHDALIYLDSDMVILDDISEVFSTGHSILAAPDAGEFRIGSKYAVFNGGLLVLKKEVHTMGYREKLINHALSMKSMALADQTIMNSFFSNEISLLNSNYNCLKRCFPDNKFNQFKSSIKIVHYVGSKPWDPIKSEFESRYQKIENIWKRELIQLESKSQIKLGVFIHIYYIDLWNEISNEIKKINIPFDLHVSLCKDNRDISEHILKEYPEAYITKVKNSGADFGGFFESLNNSFDLNLKYDWILKIHGKKSKLINEKAGDTWRKSLYKSLIEEFKLKILNHLNNPEAGMIGPKNQIMTTSSFDKKAGKNVNGKNIDLLRNKFNIKDNQLKFFKGSMFWIKYSILEDLFKDNRITIDFFEEGHSTDGTLAHAMERFMSNIVRDSGKKIIET